MEFEKKFLKVVRNTLTGWKGYPSTASDQDCKCCPWSEGPEHETDLLREVGGGEVVEEEVDLVLEFVRRLCSLH